MLHQVKYMNVNHGQPLPPEQKAIWPQKQEYRHKSRYADLLLSCNQDFASHAVSFL